MEASPLGSVDKALLALDTLAGLGPEGAPLAALAQAVGVSKPTLHRTLAALRHRGYAEQTADGAYRLGPSALALGSAYLAEENLPALLHPALAALSAEVDELVHLGVLAGREVVYLDKVEPQRAVRVWSAVGRRRPAATTALGRALLSTQDLDDAALERYAGAADADARGAGAGGAGAGGAGAGGPGAAGPGDGARRLREVLAEARRAGVAGETEENEPGIACVAVPVLRAGRAVAAVSITAPVERLRGAARAERVRALRELLPPLLPAGLVVPPSAP
ncbi:IclR family transcriptional regulator [Promicromonospora thailandica]|uniref:Transcriptional regulator, IclR family n=1 Tax=Promicromonospora thailandica TaxID=765201 RepID=A0A9X2G1H7_9MICO|nr:IclR family transcriptional regulator [Promicromonospora thailandica]MCP2263547.1 transcriptional regulator, IclR family [Promicromonospora thailandica]